MYRKSNKGWLKHIDFIIIDMVSLEVSFFLAYMIRHGFHANLLNIPSYHRMVFVLILIEFVSAMMLRTYSGVLRRGYLDEIWSTIKQAGFVTLLSVLYLFSVQSGDAYSRITLFLTGFLYAVIGYITRIIWKKNLNCRSPVNPRSMVIITTKEDAAKAIDNFKRNNYANVAVTGLVITDTSLTGKPINGIPVVADRETVEDYVLSNWIDEVLIGIPIDSGLSRELHMAFLEMGITLHQALIEVENDSTFERDIERVGGYTVITRSIRILTPMEAFFKRAMDIAGGIVGCILTGILLLIVGPAIYIASPGPIIFSQERVGKNGKVFKMYKFRSMYLDANDRLAELKEKNEMKNGYLFKMHDDPRIIGSEKGPGKGIGNFIRKTSIDEFPQFWNVLKGDMSLVGTRPPLLSEWELYEARHRARMAAKPGITGIWQVSGRNNMTDFEKIVEYDTEYIENWSFGLDIKIIIMTVIQIFKREGAM